VEFEWDEAKARRNLEKHGVDFADVVLMFAGLVLNERVERHDYGEQRVKSYGEVEGRVLCVVWTARGDRRRFISARFASRRERRKYRALHAARLAGGRD
jgi:uncharacterized DUF497 family protein